MGNKYTGNRYVPKVMSMDDGWSNAQDYEALVVVCWQGGSYTSRKYVPKGVDINNKDYWAFTGNYDAQVEQYRQDTINAVQNVNNKLDSFSNTQDGKFTIMLNTYKNQINAYADGKYADIDTDINTINGNLEQAKTSINNTMTSYETSVQASIDNYTTTVNNQIQTVENVIASIDLIFDEGTSTDVEDDSTTIIDEGVV
jgi:hypothetical protein